MPTARLQFWLFLIVRDRMGWHPGVVCVSGLVDRCLDEYITFCMLNIRAARRNSICSISTSLLCH